MGKFYRGGKLISADTLNPTGLRTLAAATESTLWAGTAATRPRAAGVQIEVVSTSVDDDQTRAQKGTITISGTMDVVTTDDFDGTVGGAPAAGNVCRLTLNSVAYDYLVAFGNTTTTVATGVKDAANLGSFDQFTFALGGVIDIGDTVRLNIGAATYGYTAILADTATSCASAIVVLAAADPLYTVTSVMGSLFVKSQTRGAGATVTCLWSIDPGADATVTTTHNVTGQPLQTDWLVSNVGAAVDVLNTASGTTTDTAAGSATGGTTFSLVHTVTGANADVLAVSDGTTTFSRTVATAVLATEVGALAALLDANAAYVATSLAGVITITAAVAGTPFTLTDQSVDSQALDLVVVITDHSIVQNGDGPGVRAVRVDYLDSTGVRQLEVIDLDGTTATTSAATDVADILAVTATEVGSSLGAVGTISVRAAGGGTQFDVVSIGRNESLAAVYTVPLRQRAWVTALQLSAGATATTVRLKSDVNPATGAIVTNAEFTRHIVVVGTDPTKIDPSLPIGPFPAGAQIWLTGTHAAGTSCQGQIEGYIEPT